MKKLFTLAIIASAFVFQQSSAQIQKGEKMLGLTLGIASSGSKYEPAGSTGSTSKAFTLDVSPQLGFGIGNNWILGISAGYALGKSRNENAGDWSKSTSNSFSGGVFARKFFPIGSRFGLFGQADAFYGGGKGKTTGSFHPTSESKYTQMNLGVRPGGYFRANKRFIFETTIGFIGYVRSTSQPDAASTKSVNSAVALSLINTMAVSFKFVL